MAAHYLVIANNINALSGEVIPAREVYTVLMDHGFWDFAERAPFFRKFKPGDKLVFYLAGVKERRFVGTATVAEAPREKTKGDIDPFAPARVPFYPWRVTLKDIKRWGDGKTFYTFVNKLSFLNTEETPLQYIGLKFKGGLRALTEEDYRILLETPSDE